MLLQSRGNLLTLKIFSSFSRRGAQASFSLEDLDFTCDNLNNHFLSVADKIVQGISFTNISLLSFITVNAPLFHLNTVLDDTIISFISSLDTNKAAGVDGIPARFITAHPASIGGLIALLVNHSISVLPVLLKVLERIVYDQLLSHWLSFDLLSDRQSGFRPQYSTQDVLLYVTDRWREAIYKSMFTAVAFLYVHI